VLANGKTVPGWGSAKLGDATVSQIPALDGSAGTWIIASPKLNIGVYRRSQPGAGYWLNVHLALLDGLKPPAR
jgi:hypothetical protein